MADGLPKIDTDSLRDPAVSASKQAAAKATSKSRLKDSSRSQPDPKDDPRAKRRNESRKATEAKAASPAQEEEEEEETGTNPLIKVVQGSASWMTSLVVHMVLIIILAMWFLPPQINPSSLIAGLTGEEVSDDLEEIPLVDLEQIDLDVEPEDFELQPETENIEEEISNAIADDLEAAPMAVELHDFSDTSAPDFSQAITGFDGSALSGRGHASRQALVRKGGGSAASEEAVALALAWLAEHQLPDGTWHLDHSGGKCQGRCGNPGTIKDSSISATALALLPFLGAGQTHSEGKYKDVVGKGLDALVRLGKPSPNGVNWMDGGTMYAHGLSSIALCEAYGMTSDSRLQAPAQASIDFIVYAQYPQDGGWRYRPRTPGDTSVVGWQVMALKSGHLAGLRVPNSTVLGASKFLDLAQMESGAAYAYVTDNKNNYRPGTSAVGLLSRMYLGWKKDEPALIDGIDKLAKRGPSKTDFYYNYYASQAIFQLTGGTGNMWRNWNEKLRDFLVASQSKEGHEKGSWNVRGNHSADTGGRLYNTAMACMNLEVYYRHMPIYRTDAVDNEFPE